MKVAEWMGFTSHRGPAACYVFAVVQLVIAWSSYYSGPRDPILITWMLIAAGFNLGMAHHDRAQLRHSRGIPAISALGDGMGANSAAGPRK